MNNYDKILKIIEENHGYIRTKDLEENNINRFFLTKLVKKDILVRISRGYYGKQGVIVDSYASILSRSQNAVFSMSTALYLHDLSDRNPLTYDVTVPYHYGGELADNSHVKLFYVKKDILHLGETEIASPFNSMIKVYDMEKTICDIVKYKNKIDREIYVQALKKYVMRKDKNLNLLMKYAEIMKIENKIMDTLEVLL